WRTRGWAALTANSQFTASKSLRWQGVDADIVYSGVDESFIERNSGVKQDDAEFLINVVGSVYFFDRLDALLAGIDDWGATLAQESRKRVTIRYLGGDVDMFERVAQR